MIKELRTKTGMSQSEFASHFGIPVKTLQQWERNGAKPAIYIEKLIEDHLNMERKLRDYDVVLSADGVSVILRDNVYYLLYDGQEHRLCKRNEATAYYINEIAISRINRFKQEEKRAEWKKRVTNTF